MLLHIPHYFLLKGFVICPLVHVLECNLKFLIILVREFVEKLIVPHSVVTGINILYGHVQETFIFAFIILIEATIFGLDRTRQVFFFKPLVITQTAHVQPYFNIPGEFLLWVILFVACWADFRGRADTWHVLKALLKFLIAERVRCFVAASGAVPWISDALDWWAPHFSVPERFQLKSSLISVFYVAFGQEGCRFLLVLVIRGILMVAFVVFIGWLDPWLNVFVKERVLLLWVVRVLHIGRLLSGLFNDG